MENLMTKIIYLRGIIILVAGLFTTCAAMASMVGEIYRQDMGQIPSLGNGKARLVFYGTDYGFYGVAAGGDWKPKILINGQDIKAPNYSNIYFVMDVSAGDYKIEAKYPKVHKPKSELPYFHQFTQGYTLKAVSGYTYYHEMTITGVKTNESFLHDFDYFLSLWRVEEDSALPQIERMRNWYKVELEEKSKQKETEEDF
jgi:hypothetical protein